MSSPARSRRGMEGTTIEITTGRGRREEESMKRGGSLGGEEEEVEMADRGIMMRGRDMRGKGTMRVDTGRKVLLHPMDLHLILVCTLPLILFPVDLK